MVTTETWVSLIPMMLSMTVVMYASGYVIARIAGLNKIYSLTIAPVLSLTVVMTAAVLTPRIGMNWGVSAWLLVTVIFTLCALALRRFSPGQQHTWDGTWKWLLGGILLGGSAHSLRFMIAIPEPEAPAQTFDSVFHLNLLHKMIVSGDASLLSTNITTYGTDRGFYPAVWHEVTSLASIMSGNTVAGSATASLLYISIVVWPLSIALLMGRLMHSYKVAGLTAALACLIPAMPTLYNWFGLLYPNLLAYAVFPVMFFALMVVTLGNDTWPDRVRVGLLALISVPAFALTHPSAFFSFILLAFPILVTFGYRTGKKLQKVYSGKGRFASFFPALGVTTVCGLYVLIERLTMLVPTLRSLRTGPLHWKAFFGPRNGLARALSLTGHTGFEDQNIFPFLLGIIVLIGGFAAIIHYRMAVLAGMHLVSVIFYVLAVWLPEAYRPSVLGLWYADPKRFEALLGITGVPLLALGAIYSAHILAKKTARSKDFVTLAVTVSVFIFGQFSSTLNRDFERVAEVGQWDTFLSKDGRLLSEDEYLLLKRLPSIVPEGTMLLGDPWTGAAFAPVVSGYPVAFTHVGPVTDPDAEYLGVHLNHAYADPKVCEIVKKRNLYYVLDFRDDYLWGKASDGHYHRFDGLRWLDVYGVAETIAHERSARLQRVTACDDLPPSP